MKGTQPRTAWIVPPPEICTLCKEPLSRPEDTSSWNGKPAHRECVRVHMIQRDPAFREWGTEESPEEPGEGADDQPPREDDDEELG
ncbi:MAG TPA: hypothetical protein VGV89_04690 [Thermoplasmata archaeon]|nr:hypothetical protein [Thermoplasmata archaeon]